MRYPILNLEFAIPVTIGSGRVVIDPDGTLRLDLYDPNDQIVVMERMAPLERAVPEREHKEGCCTNSDGTWSESQECDAQCWCHIPVGRTEPITPEEMLNHFDVPQEVAAKCTCSLMEAPAFDCPLHGADAAYDRDIIVREQVRERVWPVPGVDEEKPSYDPRASGTVYPAYRGQTYRVVLARANPWGKVILDVCKGCGVVVWDRDQHDYAHSKGRSIV